MSVSIKVAVRCRPFSCEDQLGVKLMQLDEENGEVSLLNSKYTKNRFGFSWAWWSAHNWQRNIKGNNQSDCEEMKFMDQESVYQACGSKIKADLLDGNAVVMFAYGLSGSGKTFTVFGPDDPAADVAWFKHGEPHSLWGIFPHMAYEVCRDKQDGWKISMKYFQNVVSIVRDLQSPVCKEESYKTGMRKDKDGFMDIMWCTAVNLRNWDDLRENFMSSNARKAISPTQFNHQSTRGHCIMTLEVEMPHPEREGVKQKGRVYVCDLAGTEPAGDIVYAKYKTVTFEDGSVEHKYVGPHGDPKKTKELQDQGKKINLSLTEMAQFFMKMAQAIKKKKLKAGKSIPGCNSYFLCKYLKDTMLQARTYLFCAIRPEVKYHSYTYSTLGFAKNASVVKLQPKKATANASAAERKLMKELDEMRKLVAQLQASGGGGSGNADTAAQMAQMQAMLDQKTKALEDALASQGATGASEAENKSLLAQQQEEYKRRGIDMVEFTEVDKLECPYLINLAEDEFRNKRFLYRINKNQITFGPGGDVQPMSYAVTKDHCVIIKEGEGYKFAVGASGDGFVNGKKIAQGSAVALNAWDRIVFGNDLYLFLIPGVEKPDFGDGPDKTTADFAASEFRSALQNSQTSAQQAAFAAQMKQFEEEKKKFMEEQKRAAEQEGKVMAKKAVDAEAMQSARMAVKQELMEIVPKLKDITKMFRQLDRSNLTCEATMLNTLAADTQGVPIVKVKVANVAAGETIILDPFEFNKVYQVMRDEIAFLQGAIKSNSQYQIRSSHDPINLLFDHTFQIGTAIYFIEYLIYYFPSEDADVHQDVSNVIAPHNKVGALSVMWKPLKPGDVDADNEDVDEEDLPQIEDPSELIDKPWTYQICISGARDLAEPATMAYCQYKFFGETHTTDTFEAENASDSSSSPTFEYTAVHHVDCVTQEFLDFLQEPFHINLFIKPHISQPPKEDLNTSNPVIIGSLSEGEVSSTADPLTRLKMENARLKGQNEALRAENEELKRLLGSTKAGLAEAKSKDKKLNP